MPVYQYFCKKCNHVWDERYLIKDREIPTKSPCPECNENNSISICIGNVGIGDPIRLGLRKADPGMTKVLKAINKKYRGTMQIPE